MTTLTTLLGMIPMAISQGQGAEMWRPMAISVIGGLLVSTVLTLILVPSIYCIFASVGIKRERKSMVHKREIAAYYEAHKSEMVSRKKSKTEN